MPLLQTLKHQKAHQRAAEAHVVSESDLDQIQSKNVPVFDKSVDYINLVRSENERMQKLQSSLEFESTAYLDLLELVIKSEKKLAKEI